jgi:hypothetical protein
MATPKPRMATLTMCLLGYDDVVDEWDKVDKWYA